MNRRGRGLPGGPSLRTAVAIAVGVRTAGTSDCAVRYTRVRGERAEKLGWLSQARFDTITWTDVPGTGLDPLVPRTASDYRNWPEITDLFPWFHSGCQYKRTWPIGPSKSVLERRWATLVGLPRRERGGALRETTFRSLDAKVGPLVGSGPALKSIGRLRAADRPEVVAQYGYRSFNRQWAIADNRLADRPRPALWSSYGSSQLFLTTLTSTKLGRGPVVTATPYVSDLHHFRGSYGAKDIMPLYRDHTAREPNVTSGLLARLREALETEISVEDLAAYLYGLAGTAAFAERFADELGEASEPVRIPITADLALFERVGRVGRDLLWWHTWGERFRPEHASDLPLGKAKELESVRGYPDAFSYDGSRVLTVGTGCFDPVSPQVWSFEVSGLNVLQSWLGYRMANGKGKKSSPLDDIRPERWTFTDELLRVIAILQHTIDVTSRASELLAAVIAGPLLDSSTLPTPDRSRSQTAKDLANESKREPAVQVTVWAGAVQAKK